MFFIDEVDHLPVSGSEARLGSRAVATLDTAEQLVVWAFREVATSERGLPERLGWGFQLAFGSRLLGRALCGFDGLRRCLGAAAVVRPQLRSLRCAALSHDEEALLEGLTAAQVGDRQRHRMALGRFTDANTAMPLWRHCRIFTGAMSDASLPLTETVRPAVAGEATRH
jgi:hypothetical protein